MVMFLHSLKALMPSKLELSILILLEYHIAARQFSDKVVESIKSFLLCQNGYLKLQ